MLVPIASSVAPSGNVPLWRAALALSSGLLKLIMRACFWRGADGE